MNTEHFFDDGEFEKILVEFPTEQARVEMALFLYVRSPWLLPEALFLAFGSIDLPASLVCQLVCEFNAYLQDNRAMLQSIRTFNGVLSQGFSGLISERRRDSKGGPVDCRSAYEAFSVIAQIGRRYKQDQS